MKLRLVFWVIFIVFTGFFSVSFAEKPQYFYSNKDVNRQLQVSAQAYLVGDLNTGEIILSKNQDQKFPIASISKLMTALVASEITKSDDLAKISKKAINTPGKNGNLTIGGKIKIMDLVYSLLLESSNDAAEVIAEHFGRDIFIKKMNQEAFILKMSSTSYEDPSGLSPKNQSTVSDIFKLVGYLNQQKQDLLQITIKRSFSNKKQTWSNISKFLHQDGYLGGKSGYTDEAKQTVVSLFSLPLGKSGSRPIAIVLLSSQDRYKDVGNILKYLKKNIYYGGEADANTDWVQKKVGTPDIKDPDFVTFTFAGDIMLDRGVKNSVIKNFNNDYSALFEKLKILKESDIVFANLEGTASDKGQDGGSLYSFRMDPAVVPALAGAGISILSVANNHVGDWGRVAYIDTLSRLKENEILYTGGGNDLQEAERPTVIEKYGIKIGFLGFGDNGPDSMEAREDKAGLLLTNNLRFDEIIKNASKQVDYLVVYFHFGEEYQAKHNARQEYLAHKAIDNGAKLIIGSHPHVVEDFEVYKESYVAYSLGNFIFDQAFSQKTMQGLLLNIKLSRDGSMTARKDIVKLNKVFQPDKIIKGREEKIKFQKIKIN
ncbi:MAG: poly-gamma-glutamate synthesis protein (capsule biosynthesis protein) [Parcubacteria group bacterium Gr01-1014_24]|nr:MAG: poly-gamma-glutamate synthesis protein (capsule biosynthesis protein) [Parcubacteria group bacterium Gr01-1014_24]